MKLGQVFTALQHPQNLFLRPFQVMTLLSYKNFVINHKHLCEKSKLACIEPDWFISLVQNRKQIVLANGVSSSEQSIKSGVAQGSILCPWCYLIYCNDLPVSVKIALLFWTQMTLFCWSVIRDYRQSERDLTRKYVVLLPLACWQ